jgi:hypothetical protein
VIAFGGPTAVRNGPDMNVAVVNVPVCRCVRIGSLGQLGHDSIKPIGSDAGKRSRLSELDAHQGAQGKQ